MASGMSHTMIQAVANAIFHGAPFAFADPHLVVLTAAPTATTWGTEVTGGSYARQPLVMAAPVADEIESLTGAVFPPMPACTVAGLAVVDGASGTPTQWVYKDGLSRVVAAGEPIAFLAGDLKFKLVPTA